MKQNICVFLITFSLFALLVLYHSDARFLPTHHQAEGEIAHNKNLQEKEDINRLDVIGLEGCDEKDEECMIRRMVAEAHLDYIYTQHHKP